MHQRVILRVRRARVNLCSTLHAAHEWRPQHQRRASLRQAETHVKLARGNKLSKHEQTHPSVSAHRDVSTQQGGSSVRQQNSSTHHSRLRLHRRALNSPLPPQSHRSMVPTKTSPPSSSTTGKQSCWHALRVSNTAPALSRGRRQRTLLDMAWEAVMSFCFATEGHSSSRKGNCSGEKNKRTRRDMRRKQRGQTGGLRVD